MEDYKKKYEEAIKVAQQHQNAFVHDVIEQIFPELAESEDEKIRKRLVEEMRSFQREAAKESCDSDFEFAKSAIAWLEKQGEQEHIIEDETLDAILMAMLLTDNTKETYGETIERYKSKILSLINQQKPVEWSKEDAQILAKIIFCIHSQVFPSKEERDNFISWLKSLRPQKQWKPSEEQMYMLNWIQLGLGDGLVAEKARSVMESLYNDLKALQV